MQVTFLDTAGTVLFVRDDMEQGNWTQEEYTVNATFPFIAGKVIEQGQRIAFRDPATDTLEMFEVRNVTNIEPDHYQQIIAEHIAVSELTDEHCNSVEITNKRPDEALATVLTGTLWSVGNYSVTTQSSVDIARGSVWQAVCAIATNWNAYITPRVTTNAAGSITGRYLDISPAQGTWRGVRLSIDKNMTDSSVVYDDTEVLTALYGYGGSVDTTPGTETTTMQEVTFANVVWSDTEEHPAKPSGQTYLEWPEKTAAYGRNGRPRFGYYQNCDITDPNTLLQKTWETLQQTCNPKISITGTVSDLYRLGYADQPLRLHDTVIVEIRQTGEKFQKEIIRLDVDLVDPTATRPEIGDYIANIVYITRDTNEEATTDTNDDRSGAGNRRGKSNLEQEKFNTFSALEKNTDKYGSMIAMVVGRREGDNYIKAGEIALSINASSGESTALINANHVNISATNTAHLLAGSIVYDANGNLVLKESTGGGVLVEHNNQGTTSTFGVWDRGNLTGGVMVQQINSDTTTYITGNKINISATNTVQTIAGAMVRDAQGHLVIKEGAGLYAEHTSGGSVAKFGIWDKGNLTGGVMVTQINGQSAVKIKGSLIEIDGDLVAGWLDAVSADMGNLSCATLDVDEGATIEGVLSCEDIDAGDIGCGSISSDSWIQANSFWINGDDSHGATWKSKTVTTSVGNSGFTQTFVVLDSNGNQTSWNHKVITDVSYNTDTIYYLGHS